MFFKQKVTIEDFLTELCKAIISFPDLTYKDYVNSDPERALTEDDFNLFNNGLVIFRLTLIMCMLLDKKIDDNSYCRNTCFGDVFKQSIVNAFVFLEVPDDQAKEVYESAQNEIDKFFSYLSEISNERRMSFGLAHHYCIYYALKFRFNNVTKEGTIACFIKNNRDILKTYLERMYKSI